MDNDSTTKKLRAEPQPDKALGFTELETQCVLQFIQNKLPANIGVDLGLSHNTVCFYLINAGQKLRLIGKNNH